MNRQVCFFPVLLTQSANSGETSTRGIDVFGKYGSEKLQLWGSVSWVDAERKLGTESLGLDKIAPINIRLGSTYSPISPLSMTLSMQYRDEAEGIRAGYTGPLDSELDSAYQFDFHGEYRFNDMTRLFATVKNLTDNKYATKGILAPTVQEGRKFLLGFEIDL